jgi:nucleotide-binding universal stress UspA family protein
MASRDSLDDMRHRKTPVVMLAVDGSPESIKAAKYAFKIAGMLELEVLCIHVIASPPLVRSINPALVAHYLTNAERHAKKWLKEIESLAGDVRLRIDIVIDAKSVAETIIEKAAKLRVELIVMGAKGRTLSKKLQLGSVAYSVSAHADCPVLLVR